MEFASDVLFRLKKTSICGKRHHSMLAALEKIVHLFVLKRSCFPYQETHSLLMLKTLFQPVHVMRYQNLRPPNE